MGQEGEEMTISTGSEIRKKYYNRDPSTGTQPKRVAPRGEALERGFYGKELYEKMFVRKVL